MESFYISPFRPNMITHIYHICIFFPKNHKTWANTIALAIMNTLKLQYLSRTERNPKATTLTGTPMPTLSIKLTKQNSFYWHSDFSLGCYVWLKIGQKSKDLKNLSIYFLLISFFASTRLWPFIFIQLNSLKQKIICAKFG